MNQLIIATGYMGSGSSAVTDLISETASISVANGSYEYIFMHCPNGLFDLEDKLLIGNNAIRSDEAVHSFIREMDLLYNNSNYWPGSYKKTVSRQFMKYVDEFIAEISTSVFDESIWYYQVRPITIKQNALCLARRLLTKISLGKVHMKPPVNYKKMIIAFPESKVFYSAAKKFLNNILIDMGLGDGSILADQLVLPHNLFRMDHYFDDNTRVIVVDRDPRDVFLLNKYIWNCRGMRIPYPFDALSFCRFYREMRKSERPSTFERILRIHFEDLIYNYDEAIKEIFDFIGIDYSTHINKFSAFCPNKSIINTQIFNRNPEYMKEAQIIEKELAEYLYDFPKLSVEETDMNEKDMF